MTLFADAGAALPDCMCNPDAFDTMARLLDDGVGIHLENLLAGREGGLRACVPIHPPPLARFTNLNIHSK